MKGKVEYRVEEYDDDEDMWLDTPLAIYKYVDGLRAEVIGVDGGEPEDQTLARDWSWVCGALNDAYQEGWVSGEPVGFARGFATARALSSPERTQRFLQEVKPQ